MMDGYINVLKPPGMSSGGVVGLVKHLTGMKAGHAGTLDPEACGVLPVMVGRAARLFDFLVEKRKVYLAEIAFGYATDTQDAQGTVIAVGENYPDAAAIKAVLPMFIGDILQRPPMYSALKQNGRTLYSLARQGIEAEIEPRPIFVENIELLEETPRHGFLMRITCGRGTYIRTLCHDIGAALNCPAHMRFLLREQTGAFTLETAYTPEELREAKENGTLESLILAPDAPLGHLPRIDARERLWKKVVNGVPLGSSEWQGEKGPARLYCKDTFIGVWEADAEGFLKPRAVLNTGKEVSGNE